LLLAAGSAAAGGIGEGRKAPLRVWVLGPDASAEASYADFRASLDAFRKAHPRRRVDAAALPAAGYGERLEAALAADGGPDVFVAFGAARLRPLVTAGRILELDPYLDASLRSRLLPGMTDNFVFDGKTYGLPFGAHAAALFCNRDLFHSSGIADLPASFEALVQAARTFRSGGAAAFALGYRERWPAALFFEALAARHAGGGAAVRERVAAGRFADPAFLAAAYDVKRLVDAGAFRADAASLSMFAEGLTAFRQGRAAMIYHGSWLAGVLDDATSAVRGLVEVAAFPGAATAAAPGADSQAILWGGAFSALCVNAKSGSPADAAEFVKEIALRQDRIAWKSGTSLPSYRGTRDGDGAGTGLDAQVAVLMEKSAGLAPNWDLLLGDKAAQAYLDAVAGLFRGALTPERFVASLGR
jgi:raffinose/stachyose/melibiose transport system substrate-binding protein